MFPAMFFVWTLVFGVLVLLLSFGTSRVLGVVATKVLSSLWRDTYVSIHELYVRPIGGKVVFRGVVYATRDYCLKIAAGSVTLKLWPGRSRRFGDPDDPDTPCGVHLSLTGLRFLLFNSSSQFAALKAALAKRSGDDSVVEVSTSSETQATPVAPSARRRLPRFYQTFPAVSFSVGAGCLMFGGPDMPTVSMLTFSRLKGVHHVGPAEMLEDLYRHTTRVELRHPVVRMARNAEWAPGCVLARGSDDQEDGRMAAARCMGFFKKVGAEAVDCFVDPEQLHRSRLPREPAPSTKADQYPTWQAYAKEYSQPPLTTKFYSEQDWALGAKVLRAKSLTATYFEDVPGPVVTVSEQISAEDAPKCGLNITLNTTNMVYGPWAERQRYLLFAALLPSDFWAPTPAHKPSVGEPRAFATFPTKVVLQGRTEWVIPFRSPMKVPSGSGPPPDPIVRYRTEMKNVTLVCEEESTLSLQYDAVSWRGPGVSFVYNFTSDFRSVRLTNSLDNSAFLCAERMEVGMDITFPPLFSDVSKWEVSLKLQSPRFFLLFDHVILIVELFDDLFASDREPADGDALFYAPADVVVKVDAVDGEILLNANERNVIAHPTDLSQNAHIALSADRFRCTIALPPAPFHSAKRDFLLDFEGHMAVLSILLPSYHTASYALDTGVETDSPRVPWRSGLQSSERRILGVPFLWTERFDVKVDYMYYFTVDLENFLEELTLDFDIVGGNLRMHGFAVAWLLSLLFNYTGPYEHFRTSSTGDTRVHIEPGNFLEAAIKVKVSDGMLRLPPRLYAVEDEVLVAVGSLEVDGRVMPTYFDLSVSLGPIALSFPRADEGRTLESDLLSVTMHMMLGSGATASSYRENYRITLGSVRGSVTPSQLELLAGFVESFVTHIDDKENRSLSVPGVPSYDDHFPIFLSFVVELGEVSLAVWGTSHATHLLLREGMTFGLDVLATLHQGLTMDVRLPSIELRQLMQEEGRTWREVGRASWGLRLTVVARDPSAVEDLAKQEAFLREQDRSARRLAFLYELQETDEGAEASSLRRHRRKPSRRQTPTSSAHHLSSSRSSKDLRGFVNFGGGIEILETCQMGDMRSGAFSFADRRERFPQRREPRTTSFYNTVRARNCVTLVAAGEDCDASVVTVVIDGIGDLDVVLTPRSLECIADLCRCVFRRAPSPEELFDRLQLSCASCSPFFHKETHDRLTLAIAVDRITIRTLQGEAGERRSKESLIGSISIDHPELFFSQCDKSKPPGESVPNISELEGRALCDGTVPCGTVCRFYAMRASASVSVGDIAEAGALSVISPAVEFCAKASKGPALAIYIPTVDAGISPDALTAVLRGAPPWLESLASVVDEIECGIRSGSRMIKCLLLDVLLASDVLQISLPPLCPQSFSPSVSSVLIRSKTKHVAALRRATLGSAHKSWHPLLDREASSFLNPASSAAIRVAGDLDLFETFRDAEARIASLPPESPWRELLCSPVVSSAFSRVPAATPHSSADGSFTVAVSSGAISLLIPYPGSHADTVALGGVNVRLALRECREIEPCTTIEMWVEVQDVAIVLDLHDAAAMACDLRRCLAQTLPALQGSIGRLVSVGSSQQTDSTVRVSVAVGFELERGKLGLDGRRSGSLVLAIDNISGAATTDYNRFAFVSRVPSAVLQLHAFADTEGETKEDSPALDVQLSSLVFSVGGADEDFAVTGDVGNFGLTLSSPAGIFQCGVTFFDTVRSEILPFLEEAVTDPSSLKKGAKSTREAPPFSGMVPITCAMGTAQVCLIVDDQTAGTYCARGLSVVAGLGDLLSGSLDLREHSVSFQNAGIPLQLPPVSARAFLYSSSASASILLEATSAVLDSEFLQKAVATAQFVSRTVEELVHHFTSSPTPVVSVTATPLSQPVAFRVGFEISGVDISLNSPSSRLLLSSGVLSASVRGSTYNIRKSYWQFHTSGDGPRFVLSRAPKKRSLSTPSSSTPFASLQFRLTLQDFEEGKPDSADLGKVWIGIFDTSLSLRSGSIRRTTSLWVHYFQAVSPLLSVPTASETSPGATPSANTGETPATLALSSLSLTIQNTTLTVSHGKSRRRSVPSLPQLLVSLSSLEFRGSLSNPVPWMEQRELHSLPATSGRRVAGEASFSDLVAWFSGEPEFCPSSNRAMLREGSGKISLLFSGLLCAGSVELACCGPETSVNALAISKTAAMVSQFARDQAMSSKALSCLPCAPVSPSSPPVSEDYFFDIGCSLKVGPGRISLHSLKTDLEKESGTCQTVARVSLPCVTVVSRHKFLPSPPQDSNVTDLDLMLSIGDLHVVLENPVPHIVQEIVDQIKICPSLVPPSSEVENRHPSSTAAPPLPSLSVRAALTIGDLSLELRCVPLSEIICGFSVAPISAFLSAAIGVSLECPLTGSVTARFPHASLKVCHSRFPDNCSLVDLEGLSINAAVRESTTLLCCFVDDLSAKCNADKLHELAELYTIWVDPFLFLPPVVASEAQGEPASIPAAAPGFPTLSVVAEFGLRCIRLRSDLGQWIGDVNASVNNIAAHFSLCPSDCVLAASSDSLTLQSTGKLTGTANTSGLTLFSVSRGGSTAIWDVSAKILPMTFSFEYGRSPIVSYRGGEVDCVIKADLLGLGSELTVTGGDLQLCPETFASAITVTFQLLSTVAEQMKIGLARRTSRQRRTKRARTLPVVDESACSSERPSACSGQILLKLIKLNVWIFENLNDATWFSFWLQSSSIVLRIAEGGTCDSSVVEPTVVRGTPNGSVGPLLSRDLVIELSEVFISQDREISPSSALSSSGEARAAESKAAVKHRRSDMTWNRKKTEVQIVGMPCARIVMHTDQVKRSARVTDYWFDSAFDRPISVSLDITHYTKIKDLVATYVARVAEENARLTPFLQTDVWALLSGGPAPESEAVSPSNPQTERVFNQHSFVLQPALNVLSDLTPSVSTVLGWVGIQNPASAIPRFVHTILTESLEDPLRHLCHLWSSIQFQLRGPPPSP